MYHWWLHPWAIYAVVGLFIIIVGPRLNILLGVGTTLGNYASNIIDLSNFVDKEDDKYP